MAMAAALRAAEAAIDSIGLGYDIAEDLRLKYCKSGNPDDPMLIEIEEEDKGRGDIVLPGGAGVSIPNVCKSIKCDKGERMRFSSDVHSFQQVLGLKEVTHQDELRIIKYCSGECRHLTS